LLLYYITDRTQLPGGEAERRERLLDKIAEAARGGVDYIQLREKDLRSRDLETLARQAMERIHAFGGKTRLLINSCTDVALAVGADGVHLRSRDVAPDEVRKIWRAAGRPSDPTMAASCHTEAEVAAAEEARVDFVVFGPVFGKKDALAFGAAGLDTLRTVCRSRVPVFALGGVTLENAAMCADAGAKGMAGIRIFQENDVAAIAAKLRG
jgi:thiamine-phosphate pyrophosphorylase